MKNVKLIGVGGIGTSLLFFLSRHMNFKEDRAKLTLVDGDSFELKNAIRQDFSMIGNKAKVKAEELAKEFTNISIRAIPEFITKDNLPDVVLDGDIVLLAVDNHATRKLVSEYCQKLSNVVLISGGNELTDGNVQVYIRMGGKDITLPLTASHPEIQDPADRSPGEMSCEERAKQPGSRQILVANAGAAWLMYVAYWLYEEGKIDCLGEFYFDINEGKTIRLERRASRA